MKYSFLSSLFLPAVSYSSDRPMVTPETCNWNQLVVEPLRNFFLGLMGFIPDLLTALCIFLVGWVVGRILQLIVTYFLRYIGFDGFAQKTGIVRLLEEREEKIAPHRWFGLLIFWIVIFISFILSLDQLRLKVASIELDHFLHFVFVISTALIIFVFGMFLSIIFSKIIQTMAQHMKMQQSGLYADLTRWTILIFTFFACLVQIGLPPEMILMVIGVIFITICIAFILAFGFGGRVWAGKILDKILK